MRRMKFNILEFSTIWSWNKDLWLLKNLEKCKKSHRVRPKPLSKEFRVEQSETKQLLLFPVSFQSGNIFIRNQITLLTRHNIKQWTVLIHHRGRTANSPGITGNWKLKTKKTQVARSLCLLGRGGVGAGLRLSGLNPSPAYPARNNPLITLYREILYFNCNEVNFTLRPKLLQRKRTKSCFVSTLSSYRIAKPHRTHLISSLRVVLDLIVEFWELVK